MSMPQTIDKLYAWIATEADGSEGVAGWDLLSQGFPAPLIGADKARVESLRPYAQAFAAFTGCKVVLKVFGGGTEIDRIATTKRRAES